MNFSITDVVGCFDYLPFGQVMPNRHSQQNYDFGFNDMRIDKELKGEFNSYDFGARMYDPRLGRWLSTDPLAVKQPSYSPFKAFLNNPLVYIDPDGRTEYETIIIKNEKGEFKGKIYREVSSNLMSGGKTTKSDGGGSYTNVSYGYDYRHVTTMTVNDAGEVIKVSERTTEILYGNGKKDTEYFGFTKEKGTIYNCDLAVNIGIKEGSGEKQKHGWNLVSSDAGKNGTKNRSLTGSETKQIEDLLAAWGRTPGGSLGNKAPDLIKDIVGIHDDVDGVKSEAEREYGANNTKGAGDSAPKATTTTTDTVFDSNGKGFTNTSKIGKEQYLSNPEVKKAHEKGMKIYYKNNKK